MKVFFTYICIQTAAVRKISFLWQYILATGFYVSESEHKLGVDILTRCTFPLVSILRLPIFYVLTLFRVYGVLVKYIYSLLSDDVSMVSANFIVILG